MKTWIADLASPDGLMETNVDGLSLKEYLSGRPWPDVWMLGIPEIESTFRPGETEAEWLERNKDIDLKFRKSG